MIYKLNADDELLIFLAKKNYSTILFCGVEDSVRKLPDINEIAATYKISALSLKGIKQYEKKAFDLIVILDKFLFFSSDSFDLTNTEIVIISEEYFSPFIVSIPKSGTNLIHNVAKALNFKVIGDGAKDSYDLINKSGLGERRINGYLPFNLFISMFSSNEKIALSSHYLPLLFNTTSKDYGHSTNPYVKDYFKIWIEASTYPIIFNYRDPRDTIISLIFYIENNPTFTYWNSITADILKKITKFEDKINYIINYAPSFLNIYYRQHFWLHSHPKVCNVSYEKLVGIHGKANSKEQYLSVSKIMIHLGVEGCPKEVSKKLYSKKSRTYRKGVIGEWRSSFSQKNKEDFTSKYGDILELYGYEK